MTTFSKPHTDFQTWLLFFSEDKLDVLTTEYLLYCCTVATLCQSEKKKSVSTEWFYKGKPCILMGHPTPWSHVRFNIT